MTPKWPCESLLKATIDYIAIHLLFYEMTIYFFYNGMAILKLGGKEACGKDGRYIIIFLLKSVIACCFAELLALLAGKEEQMIENYKQ